ncbi:hypothetical protein HPC49_42595 [Pyxidicoccus fallax]|uniref:Amine oxidase n=1 Tax=Pyxidicoccus fallax TaxID=394095 RepID=A0A848LRU8_9BACT|nr:hypothetical protein [Pyxidicoccus fallax]NMO20667.1 hypothetical protein [Pyxidicoccus fallax]NPC84895.1 hypothetical protein [Pyxidicoccus fallax]
MSGYRFISGLVGLGILLGFSQPVEAACTYAACTSLSSVDHTFTSGTRWTFSVQNCPCEGLTIRNAYFTPRGGTSRLVLSQAAIAEIHVPYLVGTPRLLDVTRDSEGLGVRALQLNQAECAGGTRLASNRICMNVEDRGYAWKMSTSFQLGELVSVSMASQLGTYMYINRWEFHDDGTLQPMLGMTGRLAYYGTTAAHAPYGSRVDAVANPTPSYGLTHMHNVYYRLDFDLGGSSNDAIARMTLQPSMAPSPDSTCSTPGTCWTNVETPILTEAAHNIVAENYSTWHIYDKQLTNSDGRNVGYELVPKLDGLWTGQVTTAEPWSEHEVWVTRFNDCETLAARNVPPHIRPTCTSAPAHVGAMVDGQSVDGQDLVVWYVNRHLHTPRDEDEVNMPTEWMSFVLKPRSFHYRNPLEP